MKVPPSMFVPSSIFVPSCVQAVWVYGGALALRGCMSAASQSLCDGTEQDLSAGQACPTWNSKRGKGGRSGAGRRGIRSGTGTWQ